MTTQGDKEKLKIRCAGKAGFHEGMQILPRAATP
jgi:hypothetical protein